MKTALQIDDMTLAESLKAAFNNSSKAVEPVSCLGPTYVVLRCQGTLLHDCWLEEGELFTTLNTLITAAFSEGKWNDVDAIELCLTRNYRRVSRKDFNSKFPNTRRGIRGIRLRYQSDELIYSPMQMIAENLSFKQVLKRFLKQASLSTADFKAGGGVIEAFEARQILISLKPSVNVTMMYRGSQLVSLTQMSRQTMVDMVDGMGSWLLRVGSEDDKLPDKYIPGKGKTFDDRNLTGQLMATLSLIRYAQFTGQSESLALVDRYLNYYLASFSLKPDQASLGTMSFAALAILAHPQGDRYQDLYQMLCQQIESLWQPDGSFKNLRQDREDCQHDENHDHESDQTDDHRHHNIDAGVALLLWASQYQLHPTQQRLEQLRQSFAYYRQYHFTHRHPAFIPWHTQAWALLFDPTGDSQFREFVFEMNDWLLPLQQWDQLRSLDLRGRFYHPTYSDDDASQAAITGNYLQGLAEAYRLAVQTNDSTRANAYELAIWRGLRYIRQVQFKDEVDGFYVSDRSQVQGAVRSTAYDNQIDLENVQQSLMALLKLCSLPSFPERVTLPRQAFQRLKQDVEIAPLMAEITEKSACWFHDTSRQQKLMPQQETQSIFLRRAAKPFPPGIENARDVHASCPTEIAAEFPVVMNWVEQFVQEIGGELGRVNIVRLAPKGRVYSHIDYGDYYRVRDRYHLVLQSQAGSWMKCGSEEATMHEGEFWWFDNKQPHEAFNPSDEWRIHLIFDVLPPEQQQP